MNGIKVLIDTNVVLGFFCAQAIYGKCKKDNEVM